MDALGSHVQSTTTNKPPLTVCGHSQIHRRGLMVRPIPYSDSQTLQCLALRTRNFDTLDALAEMRIGEHGTKNFNHCIQTGQIAVMMFDHLKLSDAVLDIVDLFNLELNSDYLRAGAALRYETELLESLHRRLVAECRQVKYSLLSRRPGSRPKGRSPKLQTVQECWHDVNIQQ